LKIFHKLNISISVPPSAQVQPLTFGMPPQGLLSSGIIPGLLPFPLPHFRATASLNQDDFRIKIVGWFHKFPLRQNLLPYLARNNR